MIPRLADASLERTRECDCPPHIEQCVHFDDKILTLGSRGRLPPLVQQRHLTTLFGVGLQRQLTTQITECECDCGWSGRVPIDAVIYAADDCDAARAAFEAAADRLRAGELA